MKLPQQRREAQNLHILHVSEQRGRGWRHTLHRSELDGSAGARLCDLVAVGVRPRPLECGSAAPARGDGGEEGREVIGELVVVLGPQVDRQRSRLRWREHAQLRAGGNGVRKRTPTSGVLKKKK